MPIEYLSDRAVFHERVPAEEAEGLLEWLQDHQKAVMDLGPCAHLHTAILQILLCALCPIGVLPREPRLRAWLLSSIRAEEGPPVVSRQDR